jgi:hypothetical protein
MNRMKIATSFMAALLLVGSLLTGVAVWLLRVTKEVNGRFAGWIKQFAGWPARYWSLPIAGAENAAA